MMGFLHGIESSLINIGLNCAASGRRAPRDVRIIHRTSRGTIDRLVLALRETRSRLARAEAERDALRVEVARLRTLAVRSATRPSR